MPGGEWRPLLHSGLPLPSGVPSWSPFPGAQLPHLSSLPAPLPPPKEVINGNIKTVTEYKIDEDGKKFKVRLGAEVGALALGGLAPGGDGVWVLGGLGWLAPGASETREVRASPFPSTDRSYLQN